MVETEGSGKSPIPVVKVEEEKKKQGEERLAASPQVFYIQGKRNGVFNVVKTVPGVTKSSYVVASITEINASTGTPFLGAARMTVNNVVPLNGAIQVECTIEWPNPLDFWINGFWQ